MSDAEQALCFLAGANSIFYGDRLLTTPNPDRSHDEQLFERLGIVPERAAAVAGERTTRRCRAPKRGWRKTAAQAAAGRSRRRRTVDAREPAGFASRSTDASACPSAATTTWASRTTRGSSRHSRGRAPAGRRQRRLAPGQRSRRRTPRARSRTRRVVAQPRAAVLDRLHGEPRRGVRAGRSRRHVLEDRLNHASLVDAGSPPARASARTPTATPRPRAEG